MTKMLEVMAMNNEKALSEFIAQIGEARERIAELQNFVDDHMHTNPDEISWGDVGSAGYLVEQLTQLTDWAFQRDEYAE